MRKYFDNAYEGFYPLVRFGQVMAKVAIMIFVCATLPVWIIPYVWFFRKDNERSGEDAAD